MKPKPFDPYEFKKKVIKGVPVYYKQIETSPAVHLQICFDVGSMHDPKETIGLSHFLEHLIFDGSPKLPTKKIINDWSKMNTFNSWNAWTYYTNTTYHLRFLPEKIDTILEGLEDMIFHPLLKEEDVEHERNVITQEAWGNYKNEKLLAYRREITKNVFHGTAMEDRDRPLGWPENIASITHEQIVDWHKTHYGRGNFFMVIVGAINDTTLKKLDKFLSAVPKVTVHHKKFGKLKKPLSTTILKRADEIGETTEQALISFECIKDISQASEEEITHISSHLLSELLFERLRTERALCYGVHAGAYVQKDYIGWIAELKFDEKNLEIVKVEFWKALDDIIKGKERARFEDLKKMRVERLKAAEEISSDIIENALSDIWRFGKITTRKKTLKLRMKVTYEDVVKCLKNAFEKKLTVTEVILPSKK